MYKVGDIIKVDGRYAVIVKRESYQASAHNDRWTDYDTTVMYLATRTLVPTKKTKRFTTDDTLNGMRAEVVGEAEVKYEITVNVKNAILGGKK